MPTNTLTKTPKAPLSSIRLDVSVCDQRRDYQVTFYGTPEVAQEAALAFIARTRAKDEAAGYPRGNHDFREPEEDRIPDEGYEALLAVLYPSCEHGLSLDLCEGPNHYAPDNYFDEPPW